MSKPTKTQKEALVALAAAGERAREVVLDRGTVLSLRAKGLVYAINTYRNLAWATLTPLGRALVTEADLTVFAAKVAAADAAPR